MLSISGSTADQSPASHRYREYGTADKARRAGRIARLFAVSANQLGWFAAAGLARSFHRSSEHIHGAGPRPRDCTGTAPAVPNPAASHDQVMVTASGARPSSRTGRPR